MKDSYVFDKFPEEQRTFQTRLVFLQDLFLNTKSPTDIMSSCVQHKLKRSFEAYEQEVRYSVANLLCKDPREVLKKLK